jgi:hypothetical protein
VRIHVVKDFMGMNVIVLVLAKMELNVLILMEVVDVFLVGMEIFAKNLAITIHGVLTVKTNVIVTTTLNVDLQMETAFVNQVNY